MAQQMLCHQARAVADMLEPKDLDKKAGIGRMRSASNAGLVWERYLDIWDPRPGDPGRMLDGTARREALTRFVLDFSARTELAKTTAVRWLQSFHDSQEHALAALRGLKETWHSELETRLTIGLGTPHPTELGLSFDRNIGVPYLPGSAIKGMARSVARLREDETIELLLYGPRKIERDSEARIGDLVFLDAYPTAWPKLELDIINCHHSRYYSTAGALPTETESPIPVYFLTVAPETRFTFRLLSRSGSEDYVSRGLKHIRTGLTDFGAGAKTAVGYGFFRA